MGKESPECSVVNIPRSVVNIPFDAGSQPLITGGRARGHQGRLRLPPTGPGAPLFRATAAPLSTPTHVTGPLQCLSSARKPSVGSAMDARMEFQANACALRLLPTAAKTTRDLAVSRLAQWEGPRWRTR